MTQVRHLLPGDVVDYAGEHSVFVACHEPHPIYPGLALVIWLMPDGTWSFDALLASQDVGEVRPATPEQRRDSIMAALIGGQRHQHLGSCA